MNNFFLNKNVTMIIPIKASDFKYIEKLIPLIRKNISPKSIVIISSLDAKKKCIQLGVNFIDENKLVNSLDFSKLKQKIADLHIDTKATGWYLQQFLKLGFSQVCETEYYLVWDADMLPIRPINLFDRNGKPYLTLKKEYLHRYFLTLKRLLNIDKQKNESFIAEHMLFSVNLVNKMIKEIESNSLAGKIWWEKILYATLPESMKDAYGFSEYETYGNWVIKNYPDVYNLRKLNMLRHAKYFLGENPTEREIKWAACSFDTLSFEHFDEQIIPNWCKKISVRLLSFKLFLRLTYIALSNSKRRALREFDWFFKSKTVYERDFLQEKDIKNDGKIKIMFDAGLLNDFNLKSKSRTGIYFVSFNILKYLAKSSVVKIYLYSYDMQKTMSFFNFYYDKIPNLNLFSGDILDMDVYLSSFGKIPDKIKNTGIPCFTIIHDCIPSVLPGYMDICKDWWPGFIESLTHEDNCFSNSEYTKNDFLKYCPKLDVNKISVIPLSTNIPLKPNNNLTNKIRKKYNIPLDKKYLFSLCSLEPRKNLIRSVRTFIKFIEKNKIEDLVFIIGGSAYAGFIDKFEKELPEYENYKDKIIRAGYVDDEDLEVLYSNAEWFVYTSQYEGFGMPPLEAMSCGTAVITSNNSSLPEVVSDAGIMIDWDSDEQHIAAYEKYYFDKKYRDEMAQKGLERSKLFSWEKAADIMVEQFKKCKPNKNRTSLFLMKRNCLIIKLLFIKLFVIKEFLGKVRVYLFGFLPLLKIRKENNKIKISLFSFIPLFGKKQYNLKIKYKILGIPVFKKYFKNDNKTKYYLLGLPILKKETKNTYNSY